MCSSNVPSARRIKTCLKSRSAGIFSSGGRGTTHFQVPTRSAFGTDWVARAQAASDTNAEVAPRNDHTVGLARIAQVWGFADYDPCPAAPEADGGSAGPRDSGLTTPATANPISAMPSTIR